MTRRAIRKRLTIRASHVLVLTGLGDCHLERIGQQAQYLHVNAYILLYIFLV